MRVRGNPNLLTCVKRCGVSSRMGLVSGKMFAWLGLGLG